MSVDTGARIEYDLTKQTPQNDIRGGREMNEQEAKKLVSTLTMEEKVRLYELLSALRQSPAPAPVQ